MNVHLFDKSMRGYVLPIENRLLIETMRDVETAALAVERHIAGGGDTLRGNVRITSTDTFCHEVLPRLLERLHRAYPLLSLELICTNAHLDLARLEADITIRPTKILADHLEGEIAGNLGFATYQSPKGADVWIGLTGALQNSMPAIWMADHLDASAIGPQVDSFLTALGLCKAGVGRAILPCILGDQCLELERIPIGPKDQAAPIWVASHRDLAQVPRIAAMRSELCKQLGELKAELLGT